MIALWILLAAFLGTSSYVCTLVYIRYVNEGKDLTNPRLLGAVSLFLAIVVFMTFVLSI
ncbi:Mas-related G-protein coupled receptor member D [Filibacter tadaridae]|uniref:Uncharacterized protein n=1 Tax=Filibacter tadaridae TaxID=2483811 RepID=A0A3P5WJH8_9BACL|nr:hypothetical protein FILTAD_00659 [Filibacter tadaridae]